ncbi:MAG: serine/threonine-protein kinase [Streptosporangiaceae bacterium]
MNDHLLGGRYRLSGRIAVGGMGEVWRGTDELLDRPVAVKLLSAAHATDEAFRARFRAEARYAASLSHPNIAQVFDYGETSDDEETPADLPSGGAYLVMELVPGEPLSALIARQRRLTVQDTLRIISQAADALTAAHEAGIVHRDIKPGNLLVTGDGTTKITDFGIARAMWAAQASHLTQTGMVMGTASYVSPEQATGGTITSASDIYSLGVVAYECLTGTPPFTAETPVAIAVAHMHRPVPPLPDDVPAPVAELVIGMLAKPPEDRPQSARWVADRARQLRNELPTSPDMVAATLAGAAELAGQIAPDALTDPALGASLTRADFGKAAITGAAMSGGAAPGEEPEGTGDPRHATHRRRSAFLAAAVSVALAAIGGTVAAVMLSSHPMSTAGDIPPASPAAKSPGVSAGTSHHANVSPSQIQVPAGIMATAPNVGVGTGLSTGAATGTTTTPAKPTKTPTPVQQPTTPESTPSSTPPASPPASPTPSGSTSPASGGGPGTGSSSATNVTGSQ